MRGSVLWCRVIYLQGLAGCMFKATLYYFCRYLATGGWGILVSQDILVLSLIRVTFDIYRNRTNIVTMQMYLGITWITSDFLFQTHGDTEYADSVRNAKWVNRVHGVSAKSWVIACYSKLTVTLHASQYRTQDINPAWIPALCGLNDVLLWVQCLRVNSPAIFPIRKEKLGHIYSYRACHFWLLLPHSWKIRLSIHLLSWWIHRWQMEISMPS